MKQSYSHQNLPSAWSEREKLREKGQFWTPDWVADAMVSYVVEGSDSVFDPAVGKGAFCSALKRVNQLTRRNSKFYGTDIDDEVVSQARGEGFLESNICEIESRDFILDPPSRLFKSIVANPPYIRHHRLSKENKEALRRISRNALGETLDGRAGIHVYFLIQALKLLEDNGKLAFIMPADTCEGTFSDKLWKWITSNYCLECVITFAPDATPFPGVDTNPVIFLIRNENPKDRIIWVRVHQPGTQALWQFVRSKFNLTKSSSLIVVERNLDEALRTGLSRNPQTAVISKYTLLDFAKVMRGIATGANDFFFLTPHEAERRKIPQEFLKLSVGRTRDIHGTYVDNYTINELNLRGRPTLLFAPDGRQIEDFPTEVQQYLKEGEANGLPLKPLISSRKPWYKMECREAPSILFAYLGRRNARFIRNYANVVPLTGFLCVYPLSNNRDYVEKLWKVLQHPEVIDNLNLVAKTYGSGAIKVEPRSLERLPLPENLLRGFNLHPDVKKLGKGKKYLRYPLASGEKKNLVISPELHALVVAYAEESGMTLIAATYHLITTALLAELKSKS